MSDTNDSRGLDHPKNRNRVFWLLVIVCAVTFLLDLAVRRHPHFGWEGVPFFYAIFGFVAFWCIVIAGKHLRKLLWRPEDYYD